MRRESGQGTPVIALAAFAVIVIIIGLMFLLPAYGRYQTRANANNNVKVSNIEIRNQAQRVQIAKQKADIRKQDAIGVREAQDEIAKTLTPLYVQFEMTEALKQIATSGSNNSTVFIPAGASGIPLVSTTDANKVGRP
jgi:type II secretory pathway pseudopilin PulG